MIITLLYDCSQLWAHKPLKSHWTAWKVICRLDIGSGANNLYIGTVSVFVDFSWGQFQYWKLNIIKYLEVIVSVVSVKMVLVHSEYKWYSKFQCSIFQSCVCCCSSLSFSSPDPWSSRVRDGNGSALAVRVLTTDAFLHYKKHKKITRYICIHETHHIISRPPSRSLQMRHDTRPISNKQMCGHY